MFVNFTLPATVLVTVIIPGLPDVNINNPSGSAIQFPQQTQLATLPYGYIAHPDIGVAYKVHDVQLDWTSARRQCISEGAHLADIDTNLKLELLMPQLKLEGTWTGIYKMHGDTKWVSSSSGLIMTTLPWSSNEPEGDFYCVFVSKARRGLAIYFCNSNYHYVCELPIPKNYNAQGIAGLPDFDINNPVTNSTPTPAPAPSTLPEGYVRFPDLHSAYKVYATPVTWMQGRKRCIAEGADLAIVDTVEKVDLIYNMPPEVGLEQISVGIRKSLTSDDWVRVDNGLPVTSIPWGPDLPDGFDGCAFISSGGNSLINLLCDRLQYWYVCEISI